MIDFLQKQEKRNFSFFYSKGGSGYIRGHQMAQYLGAKENPTEGFEQDLCIYVKVPPPERPPVNSYSDVDDSPKALEYLKSHPEVGVIAISEYSKEAMSKILGRDDIVFIPHQHCNFERRLRPPRPVKTVGIIGSKVTAFQYPVDEFRKELQKLGLELKFDEDYWNTFRTNEKQEMRLNVADFYYSIDIQVGWRPTVMFKKMEPFQNPNKLGNSSSFGIPTVSFPEPSYVKEYGGTFIEATSIEEMLAQLKRLKEDPAFYKEMSDKALSIAEDYHIDSIAKRYLALKDIIDSKVIYDASR